MPLLLFLLGLLPFAVGGLMNWAMLAYPDVLPPFSLIAILFLLIWGAIAFFARPCVAGVRTLAVCLNLAAGIDLILVGSSWAPTGVIRPVFGRSFTICR